MGIAKVLKYWCFNASAIENFENVITLPNSDSGTFYLDIDECESEIDEVCPENAECSNTNGSYVCNCPEGSIYAEDDCKGTIKSLLQFMLLIYYNQSSLLGLECMSL